MANVAIIGLYHSATGVSDGQTIKTNIVADELELILGKNNVHRINSFGWKKHPLKLFLKSVAAVQKYDNVIFMTDAGGIKVFPWLLYLSNIFKKCRLHYVVVGGWLTHFPEKHRIISWFLKRYHGIYVETSVMKRALESYGFRNLFLMPNCKRLPILSEDQMPFFNQEPYRLCTLSRVMREKGIEDAIEAVLAVNAHFSRTVYTLDIYGSVDISQIKWFEDLSSSFPAEIRYNGVVPYHQTVEVLKDYYALLFPTRFFTEGIPGTIIDSYAAGVPVISSEWESYADIIDHNITGIGYSFENQEALKNILIELAKDPGRIHPLKLNCLKKANNYLPQNVLNTLIRELI